MTTVMFVVMAALAAGGIGVGVCRLVVPHPPPRLLRTNFRGADVPAVLGIPLAVAGLAGVVLVALLLVATSTTSAGESVAVAWVLVLMAAAGLWDDLRGDERPRGFAGHLGALKGRAVTGGIVKIVAAAVAGAFAAAFVPARGAVPLAHIAETIALVGLSANLVNLLDRAPGRATKASFIAVVPLMALGNPGWAAAAAPVFAVLAVTFLFDLREDAMLGDTGANPVGAIVGVGLAASLAEPWRIVAIAVLLALNLASEKWSFSKAIEATPPLRWFDGLGRRDQVAPK